MNQSYKQNSIRREKGKHLHFTLQNFNCLLVSRKAFYLSVSNSVLKSLPPSSGLQFLIRGAGQAVVPGPFRLCLRFYDQHVSLWPLHPSMSEDRPQLTYIYFKAFRKSFLRMAVPALLQRMSTKTLNYLKPTRNRIKEGEGSWT